MKRVLVTGGAGFIGSHLCDQLIAMGCEVLAFDNLDPQVHPNAPSWPGYLLPAREDGSRPMWRDEVPCWYGDVRDPNAVGQALTKWQPDTVIHLAAKVGVAQGNEQVGAYTSANVSGTAILLEVILNYNRMVRDRASSLAVLEGERPEVVPQIVNRDGEEVMETQEEADLRYLAWEIETRAMVDTLPSQEVCQVFVAGSMSAYGEGWYQHDDGHRVKGDKRNPKDMDGGRFDPAPAGCPSVGISEWMGLEPSSVYAWSKAEAERLALLVGEIHGLDVRVGRFFNTYGDRQALSNPYTGVGAIFASRNLAGMPARVYEDGLQERDFIHVSDLCRGIIAIMEPEPGLLAGQVYNVGTGEPVTIKTVAELIAANLDAPAPVVTGEWRVGDIRSAYADAWKLRSLGWSPQVSLSEGVGLLCDWVREQDVDHVDHEAAHRDLVEAGLLGGAK